MADQRNRVATQRRARQSRATLSARGPRLALMRRGPAIGGAGAALIVLACAATLLLGYLNKARCAGAPFDAVGRSLIFEQTKDSHVCYSDIQFLWLYRGVDQHLFPYLDGALTPDGVLTGGAIEYPVLSGLLMWLGAIGVHTDADYLRQSALLLAPFALLTAWMLARLAGRAALLWAIGTPLVLYAFHNWELPVVCTAVAAVFVVVAGTRMDMRTRCVLAAVLLGTRLLSQAVSRSVRRAAAVVHADPWRVGSGDRELPPTRARALRRTRRDRGRRCSGGARGPDQPAVRRSSASRAGWRRSRSSSSARRTSPPTRSGSGGCDRCSRRGTRASRRSSTRCRSPRPRWCSPRAHSRCGWVGGAGRRTPATGIPGWLSRRRCCAGSCCSTRCTRRSTRCGCCRSSSC